MDPAQKRAAEASLEAERADYRRACAAAGITAPGTSHERQRYLPEIVMRVATGEPQMLRIGNRSISLREFGMAGDRLVMRAATGTECHG